MKKMFLTLVCAAVCAVAAYSQQPAEPPTNQAQKADFTLQADKSAYCIGEMPQYVIVGPAKMVGMNIVWSAAIVHDEYIPNAAVTQVEANASYGQKLVAKAGSSFWSGAGPVFTPSRTGAWTRVATINGQQAAVRFRVSFCDAGMYGPQRVYMTPESGTILSNRLPGNSPEPIGVVFEGGLDLGEVASWRVIINNQNATEAVNELTGFLRSELLEDKSVSAMMNGFFPHATIIWIPYPVKYLQPGNNQFEVEVELVNGRKLFASASYLVRSAQEFSMKPPAATPEEKLECGTSMVPSAVPAGQYVDVWASGGNGSFWWNASGARYPAGQGKYYSFLYETPGTKTVLVNSGSQSCTVMVSVLPSPPTTSVP